MHKDTKTAKICTGMRKIWVGGLVHRMHAIDGIEHQTEVNEELLRKGSALNHGLDDHKVRKGSALNHGLDDHKVRKGSSLNHGLDDHKARKR